MVVLFTIAECKAEGVEGAKELRYTWSETLQWVNYTELVGVQRLISAKNWVRYLSLFINVSFCCSIAAGLGGNSHKLPGQHQSFKKSSNNS